MKRLSYKSVLLTAGLLPGMAAAQLPVLPTAGFTVGGTGMTPFYVMGFELGPWRDYLAQELTPAYLADPNVPPLHISWLDSDAVAIIPAFANNLRSDTRTWSTFELDTRYLDTLEVPGFSGASTLGAPGLGFERQLLTPGVFHQLENDSILGVEAIMAYQSFGTSRLGLQRYSSEPQASLRHDLGFQPYEESSYGTGVRLNVSRPLADRVTLGAGFQSRIDMEEFANYRGVYSSPADFDIPARASVGLAFQANERSSVNVSVERVMYSDVSAFPSRFLPDRFLSLLGDSTSPSFAWNDLTVYSIGYSWSDGKHTQWHAELSSRATPLPSARSLEQALGEDIADHAMMVGFSRRTGEFSRFNINAAYAPADFVFGGNVLGVASESLGQDLEVEAHWTMNF